MDWVADPWAVGLPVLKGDTLFPDVLSLPVASLVAVLLVTRSVVLPGVVVAVTE